MFDAILTWNINCYEGRHPTKDWEPISRSRRLLRQLLEDHHPTIVLLQEATESVLELLLEYKYLACRSSNGCATGVKGDGWVVDASIVTNGTNWGLPTGYVTATGVQLLVANVHLRSRASAQDATIEARAHSLREYLCELRRTGKVRAEVVGGDFNLVPYSRVLLHPNPSGLGATRCRNWVSRRRPNQPQHHRALFNATWMLEGKIEYPLASYYFEGEEESDAPWYQYDQIMLSPDVLGDFATDLIVSSRSIPMYRQDACRAADPTVGSDHFPVLTRRRG